ncbi:hypothetical protein EDB92DRAFT_1846706 [Lactarius akahatsu]|uniref:Tyrosine specific protein phosphatases domain-containing protein n=1 Tax=Lactarius akahatsu TaxID=416441 RepID=A0AAD4LP50_9AGAM|nr:hypothetical protein EDB92DRAFT_1846706 [Lactarius akahatsu]
MTDKIWQNWEEVINYLQPTLHNRKLFRSSCPNYDGHHDSSQNLNQAAVDILVQHNINRIVSFNQVAYNAEEMDRLSKANIIYRHLPVEDFTAATIDQLRLAIAFVREGSPANTLIHCGFGWGRSGTGVSAVQMFATWGELPYDVWKIKGTNHVEEQVQVDVLKELQTRYKRGA